MRKILVCAVESILDYQNLSLDGNILGLTTFETGYIKVYDKNAQKAYPLEVRSATILIDNSIAEDQKQNGRYRFTCAHEVSHWDLHKNIYFNQNAYREEINAVKCLKRDVEKSFSNNSTFAVTNPALNDDLSTFS